jgi:hypothetical protein
LKGQDHTGEGGCNEHDRNGMNPDLQHLFGGIVQIEGGLQGPDNGPEQEHNNFSGIFNAGHDMFAQGFQYTKQRYVPLDAFESSPWQ